MSEVKRWAYRDGLMVAPLPRGDKYREESVYPDEVPEWVSGADYDTLEAENRELREDLKRCEERWIDALEDTHE